MLLHTYVGVCLCESECIKNMMITDNLIILNINYGMCVAIIQQQEGLLSHSSIAAISRFKSVVSTSLPSIPMISVEV